MANKTPDVADKLWQAANFIVGFALTQTMAYIFLLPNKELAEKIGQYHVAWIVFAITACACVLYNLSVWWCHFTSIKWLESTKVSPEMLVSYKSVSFNMTIGRSIALVFFWIVSAFPAFYLSYLYSIKAHETDLFTFI